MYGKLPSKRPRVAAWASWCLAAWVAVCTASYLYVMTADRIEQWLDRQSVKQMAETHFGERP